MSATAGVGMASALTRADPAGAWERGPTQVIADGVQAFAIGLARLNQQGIASTQASVAYRVARSGCLG